MMDIHDAAHVIVDGAEGRQQSAWNPSQWEQEVYAGHLRTGHVARRSRPVDIIAASGGLPPLDPALAEEFDGPAATPNTGIEVVLLTAEGQKVWVSAGLCRPRGSALEG